MGAVQVNCGAGQDYRQRVCVADEHYVPSVLAAYGQNEARNGYGGLTYSYFPPDAHHPRSFPPGSLRTALQEMKCRNWIGCASSWSSLQCAYCGVFHKVGPATKCVHGCRDWPVNS